VRVVVEVRTATVRQAAVTSVRLVVGNELDLDPITDVVHAPM
jgi:hypothetical protein